jgi:hypothetical protein
MTANVPSSHTRFLEGENGTIVDKARGLLWMKRDTWQMTGKWMSWIQVRDYSLELSQQKFAGYGGWRMPTTAEAKSLYDKSQANTDHMGQTIPHESIFEPGFGFLYWTSEVKNKIQAIRFGFRKGNQMYDDVYRTSRGATRLVRDIEKEDGLISEDP